MTPKRKADPLDPLRNTSVGPRLAPRRAWLVADQEVGERLAAHPLLPVDDPTRRRHARLVALVLGIRALPAAGTGSIADVDLPLDVPDRRALSRMLKLPAVVLDDALTHLVIAGVIGGVLDRPGVGRFAPGVITDSPVAAAVRWPDILERLAHPPRDGFQAALMLVRLLADRVPHPGAAVELSLGEAATDLGLSADQVRRGVQALVATDCWRAEPQSGRASRYAMSPAVLWSPQPFETAAVAMRAADQEPDVLAGPPSPTASPSAAASTDDGERHRPEPPDGWTLVIPRGVRFTLPPEARDAQVSLDPHGNLVLHIQA